MNEPLENQIARKLLDFVDGRRSLQVFREWFVPISITVEESEDDAAMKLAYEIDGILAEASSAQWTDTELREELAKTVAPYSLGPVIELAHPLSYSEATVLGAASHCHFADSRIADYKKPLERASSASSSLDLGIQVA